MTEILYIPIKKFFTCIQKKKIDRCIRDIIQYSMFTLTDILIDIVIYLLNTKKALHCEIAHNNKKWGVNITS